MEEDDFAAGPPVPGAPPRRTFPPLPYLNKPWHFLVWGVGVYGGLVLVGWLWPKSWTKTGGKRLPGAAKFAQAFEVARDLKERGDFAQADFLLTKCLEYAERHEPGQPLSVFLIIEIVQCRTYLKQYAQALTLVEKGLALCDAPTFESSEETAGLKASLNHQCATLLTHLGRFDESLAVVERTIAGAEPTSPLMVLALLLKAETLEKRGETVDRLVSRARFDATMQEAVNATLAARRTLDAGNMLSGESQFALKPDQVLVSIYLSWGKMEQAEDFQAKLIEKVKKTGDRMRLAHQIEEYADICLDAGHVDKAEGIFLESIQMHELVGKGVRGLLAVHKAKVDLANKIYFQQAASRDQAQQWIQDARLFIEKHSLIPPLVENVEMRVQESAFSYPEAHPDGGVAATLTLTVRLKRKIEDKKSRLPAGARLVVRLEEWDNPAARLSGRQDLPVAAPVATSWSVVLDAETLENEDREKRVVTFSISQLRTRACSHICWLDVYAPESPDANPISTLRQHVVSLVDCSSTTVDQAAEIVERQQQALMEVLFGGH